MHALRFPIVALALAVLTAAASPSAADGDDLDYAEISLEALLDVDVVYGASKYEQKVTDAPTNVTLFTREEIDAFGYETLGELLEDVRGVYVTNDRNYDYVGVRGFARPADYNTRLLLLVDGIRVNDNIYDSAPLDHGFPVDLALVERVEVITGPGSSLYGNSAFFGVINVVTRTADGPALEVAAGAGADEAYHGRATWRRDGDLRLLASLSHRDDAGADVYSAEFDTPDQNHGVFEDGDRERATHLRLRAETRGWSFDGVYSQRLKHVPLAPWGTVFNDDRTRTDDRRAWAVLGYGRDLGLATDLELRAGFHLYDYDGHYIYDYAEEGDDEPFIVDNGDNARGRWLEFDATTTTVTGAHKIVAGGTVRRNLSEDQAVWDYAPYWQYMDEDSESTSWGVFVQDEVRAGSALILNLGLRLDHAPRFGDHLSPRLAAIWSARPDTRVKLIWGTAFRAPNIYEMLYHDGWETTKPNPDLEVERIRTGELILEHEFTPRMRLVASVFRNDLEDLISQVEDPADELLIYRNLESIRSTGAELGFEGRWGDWRARVSWSHQSTRETGTDARLSNSPLNMAKLSVLAPLGGPDTLLGLSLRALSSRLGVDGGTVDGYVRGDLTLGHRLARGVALRFGVLNVFDEDYADPGSTEHLQSAIARDGRVWRARVTLSR